MLESIQRNWFSNLRGDILAGLVVALALIPEAIAFSIIAGVDPKVGLYASFCIAVVSAFVGGRPGMISAATGAMSLLMVTLVKDHGLQYLLAATVLTGVLQIIAGYLRLGADAIRFAVSGDRVRECAGHSDFPRAITRIDWRDMACVCHDRSRSRHHLPIPTYYSRRALAADMHRRAHRRSNDIRRRHSHRW